MIPLQKIDYFDVTGGMQAEASIVNFKDNEFYLLENIMLSRAGTLVTRKGRQQYANPVSSTPIYHLDKYVTDTKQEFIMSTDGKLYYSNNSCGITTDIYLRDTLSSITNYDSSTFTADLGLVAATTIFEEGDEIYVTIGTEDYIWTVDSVGASQVTVSGIVGPPTLTVPVTCYGGRKTDEIPVSDAINFRIGDIISIGDYGRKFKVKDVDTTVTPNIITVDEEIEIVDEALGTEVAVSARWEQFTYCDKNLQDTITGGVGGDVDPVTDTITTTTQLQDTWGVFIVPTSGSTLPYPLVANIKYFVVDSGTLTCKLAESEGGTAIDIQDEGTGTFTLISGYDAPSNDLFDAGTAYISSTMLRNNLVLTDGYNEPLVYDGTEISRMGFHEVPDIYNDLTEVDSGTGSVTAGAHDYIISYSRFDNNNELIESGITEARQIVASGSTNIAIPVPIIPYKFNDELLYNVDNCVVTLYKTEKDGTNFYRAIEVPMNTLGNFHIKEVTIDGVSGDMKVEVYGEPDLSNLVVGDYILIKGSKEAGNNGVFPITVVDTTNYIISMTNASVVAETAVGSEETIGYAVVCIKDNIEDAGLVFNDLMYCNEQAEPENQPPPLAKYLTVWENRMWFVDGKNYQEVFVDIGNNPTVIAVGDTFTIKCGSSEEVYEFATTSNVSTTDAIRVDITGVGPGSLMTEILEPICETINSKPDGLCWAYYERVSGAGTLVLRERQRNSDTLQIKFDIATPALLINFRINNSYLTSSSNDTYFSFLQTRYSSRAWFSKSAQGQSFVGTFGNTSTEEVYWNDIYPDNGQVCTGPMGLPNMLIMFKEDSCFKITSSGVNSYAVEVIDNEVGCIAPKTITSIGNTVLFLSKHGVNGTDGFITNFVGSKMKREWEKINPDYITLSCAAHVTKYGQYWVTVPYNTDTADATGNNVTFVYDYNKNSWSKWTNTPFTFYVKVDESGSIKVPGDTQYMASLTGEVYSMREQQEINDYKDDEDAIESTIITKWYDFGDKISRKMFYSVILNLYQTIPPNYVELSYAYDLGGDFIHMSTINIEEGMWGSFPMGRSPYGGKATLSSIKQPLNPEKCFYVRFELFNDRIDKIIELQGLSIEAKMLNTKAVEQAENL